MAIALPIDIENRVLWTGWHTCIANTEPLGSRVGLWRTVITSDDISVDKPKRADKAFTVVVKVHTLPFTMNFSDDAKLTLK